MTFSAAVHESVHGTKGEFAAVQQIVGFLGCC